MNLKVFLNFVILGEFLIKEEIIPNAGSKILNRTYSILNCAKMFNK